MASKRKKVLIICGESSGDVNAAQLINELKKRDKAIDFYAVGGDALRKAGAEILYDIKELGIVGFTAAIQKLPVALRIRKGLIDFVKTEKPDLLIPVDFPDFNLSLLAKVNKYKIPVLYFISPQIWAWRKGRIKKIKRLVRRMLVLLPFEKEIYTKAGVDVVYVGNPAVDRVKVSVTPENFRKANKIPAGKPTITFLPGSRFHEIEDILPIMLKSIPLIQEQGDFEWIIAPATSVNIERVEKVIKNNGYANKVHVLPGEAWEAAAASNLVVTKSGTSTIEMALIGTPFIVVYKTTALAYGVAKLWWKKKEISLVNIIGGGSTVPELIQKDFTPEKISAEVGEILSSRERREDILKYLKDVRTRLGKKGSAARAAEAVLEILR